MPLPRRREPHWTGERRGEKNDYDASDSTRYCAATLFYSAGGFEYWEALGHGSDRHR